MDLGSVNSTRRRFQGKRPFWSEAAFWFALLVFSVAAILLLRYITPYGLGLVNDSVGYIAGARNLVAGNGYMRFTGDGRLVPITNYPPMFSMVMATVGVSGLEIVRASRMVNLLCFALNIFLTGAVVRKMSGSKIFGVLGAVLFLISPAILQVHSFALTEPLYLALSYAVLWSMILYLEKPASGKIARRWLWLAVSGVLSSLAFLTRYPGVALYATAVVVLLLLRPTWRARLVDITIYIVFSVPGVAIWALRNALVSGNAANRMLSFHPIPADKYLEGLRNFWGWLLPSSEALSGLLGGIVNIKGLYSIWTVLFGFLLILMIVITCRLVLQLRELALRGDPPLTTEPGSRITKVIFALYGLLYLAVIIFTLTFLDASPIFEDRILSPFYSSLLVILVGGLAWLWQQNHWMNKVVSVLISLMIVTIFSTRCVELSQDLHTRGQGFISYSWRQSGVIGVIKGEIPGDQILFSNRTQALYLLADRPAYVLLSPRNPATHEERPEYKETAQRIREMVLEKRAILVIFDYNALLENPEEQDWVISLTEGLPLYGDYWDGVIFGLLP
jgi:hypothetical protein